MTGALRRWLPLLALAVVAAVALTIGTMAAPGHQTVADRVQHITSQLKCPICSGETVADSNAPISRDIRAAVEQRVVAGQSNGQITSFIVEKFPGTLLEPAARGVGLIVWLLPVLAFAAAAVALTVAFLRWRSRPTVAVTDADRALVEEALRR